MEGCLWRPGERVYSQGSGLCLDHNPGHSDSPNPRLMGDKKAFPARLTVTSYPYSRWQRRTAWEESQLCRQADLGTNQNPPVTCYRTLTCRTSPLSPPSQTRSEVVCRRACVLRRPRPFLLYLQSCRNPGSVSAFTSLGREAADYIKEQDGHREVGAHILAGPGLKTSAAFDGAAS